MKQPTPKPTKNEKVFDQMIIQLGEIVFTLKNIKIIISGGKK